jgi:hypothetical protein
LALRATLGTRRCSNDQHCGSRRRVDLMSASRTVFSSPSVVDAPGTPPCPLDGTTAVPRPTRTCPAGTLARTQAISACRDRRGGGIHPCSANADDDSANVNPVPRLLDSETNVAARDDRRKLQKWQGSSQTSRRWKRSRRLRPRRHQGNHDQRERPEDRQSPVLRELTCHKSLLLTLFAVVRDKSQSAEDTRHRRWPWAFNGSIARPSLATRHA